MNGEAENMGSVATVGGWGIRLKHHIYSLDAALTNPMPKSAMELQAMIEASLAETEVWKSGVYHPQNGHAIVSSSN